MKIYIAAKFEDVDNYRRVKKMLENENHTITCDWTKHDKVHPFSDNHELCYKQSIEDLQGIKEADVVIMLYNNVKGSGMSFEIGYATALNKKIIIVGKNAGNFSMFVHLNNFVLCSSNSELMRELSNMNLK